jgi:site-specific recombinase XerD
MKLWLCHSLVLYNFTEQKIQHPGAKQCGVRFVFYSTKNTISHRAASHSYLIDKGTDVSMIQKLPGHNDIKTTLRYLHASNKDLLKIISPLDDLKLS